MGAHGSVDRRTHVRLARLEGRPGERARHVAEARRLGAPLSMPEILAAVDEGFGPESRLPAPRFASGYPKVPRTETPPRLGVPGGTPDRDPTSPPGTRRDPGPRPRLASGYPEVPQTEIPPRLRVPGGTPDRDPASPPHAVGYEHPQPRSSCRGSEAPTSAPPAPIPHPPASDTGTDAMDAHRVTSDLAARQPPPLTPRRSIPRDTPRPIPR